MLTGWNRGSHALLKDGARIVETADDILNELGWPAAAPRECASQVTDFRAACRSMLPGETPDLDALVALTGLDGPGILARLTEPELAGIVAVCQGRLRPPGLTRQSARPGMERRRECYKVDPGAVPGARYSGVMGKVTVVVESPAKAKTINKYLGTNYKVKASMGHVRDLPKSKLGVDIEEGFEPSYEVIASSKKVLGARRPPRRTPTTIYLATDPDREGEAIALAPRRGAQGRTRRRSAGVMFNEITKKGVPAAIEHPRRSTSTRSTRSRRAASSTGWSATRSARSSGTRSAAGLSAGPRAVGRPAPRRASASRGSRRSSRGVLEHRRRLAGRQPPEFEAQALKRDGEKIKDRQPGASGRGVADSSGAVASSTRSPRSARSKPPCRPSSPEAAAGGRQASRFRSRRRTMTLAQRLYEGVELRRRGTVGLITYMRTDSTRVSDDALAAVRAIHRRAPTARTILPEEPNVYKAKKDAQDAHEAIRPTSIDRPRLRRRSASISAGDEYKLYA